MRQTQKWNLTMVINAWQKPLLILGHSWSQWDILIGQYNTFCCQRCLDMHMTPAVVQTTPVSSFRLCFLFVFELVSFFSWLLYWLLLFCQVQKIQYLTRVISQFLSGQLNHEYWGILHTHHVIIVNGTHHWEILSSQRGYHCSSRFFCRFRRSCQCCFFIFVTL
jgi:hypothetical protein